MKKFRHQRPSIFLRISIFILSLSCVLFTNAQVTNTVADGFWSNSGVWDNGTPSSSGDPTVNHPITIDQDITIEGTCIANSTMTDDPGGSQYKAEIKNAGNFIINDDVTFEGDVKLSNNASIIVNGCATFTTGSLLIENNTTFVVAACATLIINGDLDIKNNIGIQCDGVIQVNGNVTASNNAAMTGSGSLVVTGTVDISNAATIFGVTTPCGTPPCAFGAPLPIELISFEANVNDDRVDIKWVTASEINNDYFTIERSIDAKIWEEVIVAAGAGNSSQILEYFETDYEPITGISYYRLKQTDFDGKYSYSNIVPVKYVKESTDDGIINLFPSPVSVGETVNIEFKNIFESEILVVLRDIQGKEFYSKVVIDIEDGKLIGVPIEAKIPKGIYLITATSENQMYSQKLIIK